MTPEQFQAEHLANQREVVRLLRRLCAALAIHPEAPKARRLQAVADHKAQAGGFAASQARRKTRKAG